MGFERHVHIVFNESAGKSLRHALRDLERDEAVLACPDDLSVGPINPYRTEIRVEWWRECAGRDTVDADWDKELSKFWDEALSARERTAWVHRRSAPEFCAFLRFVSEAQPSIGVIDLTDVIFKPFRPELGAYRPIGFGVVSPRQIVSEDLFDLRRILPASWHDVYGEHWARLADENADLRALVAEQLISVPITHHDQLILANTPAEWQSFARVVGHVLSVWSDEGCHQGGDSIVASRLLHLISQGLIETAGDIDGSWRTPVRKSRAEKQKFFGSFFQERT